MESFGERLESLRDSDTQKGFAKSLGIPINTYTNWVRGIREPSMSAIITLCTHLGVSADWLLGLPERGGSAASVTAPQNSGAIAVGTGARATAGNDNKRTTTSCATCKYKQFAEVFKAIQTPD